VVVVIVVVVIRGGGGGVVVGDVASVNPSIDDLTCLNSYDDDIWKCHTHIGEVKEEGRRTERDSDMRGKGRGGENGHLLVSGGVWLFAVGQ